jgi:ribosomal protein S18 acetylase RimI-like enzyme|tara:strand:- start:191 stop:568 length:378 start_codon:yes stop_codon:yes gene_type:complete
MISIKPITSLTNYEIYNCNKIINANFEKNRFNDYKTVLIYKKNNEIIGFLGIYDNLLNQLCTDIEYRRKGIAKELLDTSKKIIKKPINLYIDKNKKNTEYLLNYYLKNEFEIELENELEYKMIYK